MFFAGDKRHIFSLQPSETSSICNVDSASVS